VTKTQTMVHIKLRRKREIEQQEYPSGTREKVFCALNIYLIDSLYEETKWENWNIEGIITNLFFFIKWITIKHHNCRYSTYP